MFIIIIMIQLVDRKREMEFLEDMYLRNGASLIILYGRRRTGKSRLLVESLKNQNGIYFMATQSNLEENLKKLSGIIGDRIKDDIFSRISFRGIEDLLIEFAKRMERETILVIDEFPYLFNNRPSLLSELQRVWDLVLKETDIKIVLCGSSISMMEQKVLSRSSPLYGRREGQWRLMPLPIGHLTEFLPKYGSDDIVRTYSVCDGIPEYLLKFDGKNSFRWNIDNRLLRKGEYLSDEGRILLLQEFSKIGNYASILEAVSMGRGKQKDISDQTGMDKGMVSKYIYNLKEAGYVEYEVPYGSTRRNKRGRYIFADNYMDFYFSFIHPNMTELELDILKYESIREGLDTWIGRKFERIVRDLMKRTGSFSEVAPWWEGEEEIDVLARDGKKKKILAGDLKWRNRKYSGEDLGRFLERVERFPKPEKYGRISFVVSRNGFRKNVIDEMENAGIFYLDLKELKEPILKSRFDPRDVL